ncbi:redoxin domain-containing protein [Lutibacter sp.]|uniref:redoxin domain-containing protein n=1 Tax=Lutibacter sp. TaxID=1925666 RepID=UPI0035694C33
MSSLKKILFISSIAFLFLIGCNSKKQASFRISGKINSLKNTYILLHKIEDYQQSQTSLIDSIYINKKGEFNSIYFLQPAIYTLQIAAKKITLAIDHKQHIVVKGSSINDLSITGSKDTDLLNKYEQYREESLNRLVTSVRTQIKKLQNNDVSNEEIIRLRALEVENYQKHLNELVNFVKNKMGVSIAIYPTSLRWNNENLPFLKELVLNFENKHGPINITQQLKDKIKLLEKTNIGSQVLPIEMPSKNGQIVSLNSVKKRVTLIDFWASWCPPCRTESILLNNLYKNYNSKGFEIYGISLDTNKDRWLKALETDQRTWVNVSTLEGFNTPIAKEYGIAALPTNFLIDAEGKIIAQNIHGEQLKQKIKEVFEN